MGLIRGCYDVRLTISFMLACATPSSLTIPSVQLLACVQNSPIVTHSVVEDNAWANVHTVLCPRLKILAFC